MKAVYTLKQSGKFRNIIATLSFILLCCKANAQFVYVPDANLRSAISALIPSAIVGDSLDTSDPTVNSLTVLDVSFWNISDLDGVQYFPNVNIFICNNNPLTVLNHVPPATWHLECGFCNLTSITSLPGNLQIIYCNDNSLTSLPSLPASLSVLRAENNSLTSLPQLPNFLQSLIISGNQLTSIPPLPNGLLTILCGSNLLTAIPGLPNSVTALDCNQNSISVIPFLPASIVDLNIRNNQISCLPMLPDSMHHLYATGNTITCLPNLPSSPLFVSDIGTTICPLPGSASITNVICNGACDGSISMSIGVPYTFMWSNGSTSPSPISLCAAQYWVIVTDPNGCAYIDSFAVTQPTPVSVSANTTNATCGLSDGSITVNVTGGISPYLFSIDNGITLQPSNVFNNLPSGFYTVSAVDANGCIGYVHTIVAGNGGPAMTANTTNVLCYGGNDGSITLVASGGVAPYQYSIDTGFTMQSSNTFLNLIAGNYYLIAEDATGCFTDVIIAVTEPTPLTASVITVNNVTCYGMNDGSITINVSGGTAPYNYLWSNSTTVQNITNLTVGTYSVLVTDANGCTTMVTATITEPPPISFPIQSNVIVCNGNPVMLCPIITGGSPPYTYFWTGGIITNCNLVSSAGVYTIVVTDSHGCTASQPITVTYSTGWSFAFVTNFILPTCGMCDGSAEVIMTNTQAATYLWSPGNITTSINSQLCDNGLNTVIVTDTSGCVDTVSFTLSCHSVWPGDANNDGQADNTDLLAIGIGYGATGEPRENATIQWQSEKGVDWADSLASGTNYKHIDGNGDGAIDDNDTTAIIQNFGLTHPLRPAIIPMVLTDPPLYFDIQIDSANVDTTLQIPLMLGSAAIPADSIYGIAFTVSYDTALVKADSVTMDFMNCWMNSATGHTIGIAVNDPLNGKLYGAVTRTSHTDTSGYGPIGNFGIVTVDNISARMTSLYSDTLVLGISDVVLITHDEQYKTVNIIIDSLIINDNTVGIHEIENPIKLNVYPNPANRFLFIDYDEQITNPEFSLLNILNEEQKISYRVNNDKAIIDLSKVDSGIYLLLMKTYSGIIARKINIQRQ